MPFERMLKSVRHWLQHITGHDRPMYLIIKRNGEGPPLYLEAELDVMGETIMAYRWTRNPARATVFLEPQKQKMIGMPEEGFWYPIVELPLYRDRPYTMRRHRGLHDGEDPNV